MKAYAPYHHLYAISACFSISNNQSERVPNPSACYERAKDNNLISEIVKIAGISLNMALEGAANEPLIQSKIFSPQNWIKTKACLAGINFAIRNYFNMLPMMPGGQELNKRFKDVLALPPDKFEYRWEAD